MSVDAFFDSNVLLYAVSTDAPKAVRADSLVKEGGTISVQVLNEFANVSLKKYGNSLDQVRRALTMFKRLCAVVPLDIATHERALGIVERYRFNIFDGLIVASALLAGCKTLYTEDLQDGQAIDGLTIRNPFTG
jgi:predicted nucleic acid-binding protein